MKGIHFVEALKKKFKLNTRAQLAKHLGMSQMGLVRWEKKKSSPTPLQVANLVKSAQKAAVTASYGELIRPIVEFYPLDICSSKSGRGVNFRLFKTGKGGTKYTNELQLILKEKRGIYVFYDSRGRALYAGKAKVTTLWREMNNVLNRKRTAQSLYRVKHPKTNVAFRTSDEKRRQPKQINLRLHEMASYISVYEVDKQMIDSLEALIVRAFANDLLNIRMETF